MRVLMTLTARACWVTSVSRALWEALSSNELEAEEAE